MDAFISHRRKTNSSLALLLQTKLKADHKLNIYVDTTFADNIEPQLPETEVFICLLEEDTLGSEWVLKEIEQAYRHKKRCIPVFQESYIAPKEPSEAINYLLSFDGVHIFDVKNIYVDDAVKQIAQLVRGSRIKSGLNLLPYLVGVGLIIGLVFGTISLYPLLQASPSETATPAMTAIEYLRRGLNAYNTGDYEAALADYNRAIQLDGSNYISYNNRGLVYADLDNYEAAVADYNRAIQLNPNVGGVYYNRGNLQVDFGYYEAAIADYSRALEREPNDALTLIHRCLAYLHLRNYNEAIEDCNRVSELQPNDPSIFNYLGIAYSGLGDYEPALANYNRAIELDPNYVFAYNNRGNAYYTLGDNTAALSDYTRAITLDSNDALSYADRGLAYYTLGNYNAAVSDFTRSIELDPNYALAYAHRGTSYYLLGRYEEALADYDIVEGLGYGFDLVSRQRFNEIRATLTPNP